MLSLAEEGVFDLLLLDVHMPELDGFQVIQAIREREGQKTGYTRCATRSRRCCCVGYADTGTDMFFYLC